MGDANRSSEDSQDCEDELRTALYALNRAKSNTDDQHVANAITDARDKVWGILQFLNPTRNVD